MKILISGMTSQQVNPISYKRAVNFTGLLWETLRTDSKNDNEVYWQEPSVDMPDSDLHKFDHVIVGVTPVTALGANRAYGALSLIEKLWGSRKLSFLVDAPDPIKMRSAFQSVADHPENLVKPFFSYRKEYERANDPEVNYRLMRAVHLMAGSQWPTTIVPSLPWQSHSDFVKQLPNAGHTIAPLNLDHVILDRFPHEGVERRVKCWQVEKGTHPSWLRQQRITEWGMQELPTTFRKEIDGETILALARSTGCIIGPSKSGTWWSPRFAMSVSQRTPVFSDWNETYRLGSEWTMLPSSFEWMQKPMRAHFTAQQHESYTGMVPNKAAALEEIYDAVHDRGTRRIGA